VIYHFDNLGNEEHCWIPEGRSLQRSGGKSNVWKLWHLYSSGCGESDHKIYSRTHQSKGV